MNEYMVVRECSSLFQTADAMNSSKTRAIPRSISHSYIKTKHQYIQRDFFSSTTTVREIIYESVIISYFIILLVSKDIISFAVYQFAV